MVWVLLILMALGTFFLWAYIHEMSHVLAAHWTVGVKEYHLRLYPHQWKGSWRWAGVYYYWERQPSEEEARIIHLAPRIPDLLAVLMFPCALLMPTPPLTFLWLFIWGGGLVDFVTGSLALSKRSDLRRAANGNASILWGGRILGFALISASVLFAYVLGAFHVVLS